MTDADRIVLTGLRVRGNHGVFEHEKRTGQDFLVDVVVWADIAAAARSDDVTRTVHYGELAEQVARIVGGPSRDLIETVAVEAAEGVLAHHVAAHTVEITVHKPQAPIEAEFSDVAVTVRRSRVSQAGAPAEE